MFGLNRRILKQPYSATINSTKMLKKDLPGAPRFMQYHTYLLTHYTTDKPKQI